MIEFVGQLPTWLGSLCAMLATTGVGLAVYVVSSRLVSRYGGDELKDPIGNLFRVTGILVSLVLSLAFSEALGEVRTIRKAIEREAVAISDIAIAMRHFDTQIVRDIRNVLVDYSRSVSDDEWPALANNQLGERTSLLKRTLTDRLIGLKPANRGQEAIWASILADVDAISDNRLIRLNGALATPSVYCYVVVFGFIVTMACFGVYRPEPVLIALVSLYTLFVGLGLYLIVALSDPFTGGMALEPTVFRLLAETLATDLG